MTPSRSPGEHRGAESRGGQPAPISDLLPAILKQARQDASRTPYQKALEHVLGPEHAARCAVLRLRSGTLTLAVDSAPLLAELRSFRSEELREGINAHLDTPRVARIVFRPAGSTSHG